MAKKKSVSELADRYLAKTKTAAYLLQDDNFPISDYIDSGNYALNAMLVGDWRLGYPSARVTQFVGKNSTGKTYLSTEGLINAQKKGWLIVMIDTEFDADMAKWVERGVDPEMFIHIPIYHIKEVTKEILDFLLEMRKKDKALIVVDSVGGLSSGKETKDIVEGKDVADMTRAKELKGMFRQLIVPAGAKGVPIWIVNHEYMTIGMFASRVQGGGTGPGYGSSIIVSMNKKFEKKDADGPVTGAVITCTSLKNRFAKEQSQVTITIDFDRGLERYSGLLELAITGGFIEPPPKNSKGSIHTPIGEKKGKSKKWFRENEDFWTIMLEGEFGEWMNNRFKYQSHADNKGKK